MVKVLKIVAVGLATTMLASVVACSQGSNSEAPNPADTSGSSAEESIAPDQEADSSSAQDSAQDSKDAEESYRTVENVTPPAPGSDPLAMVFGLRQFTGEAIGSEQIKVTYPTPDQAVVVTTVRGLPDDSVSAIRTRYEFKPVEGQTGQWQMVKVSEQNKCQAGRGPDDWTAELCN